MATLSTPQSTPECPVCGGTGWKRISEAGEANRVERCECRLGARAERLLKSAQIPSRYKHCTLADFFTDFSGAHRSLAAARLAAGRFVEEYPLEKKGLLFIGPIGTGKTHLAVGIMQELISNKGTHSLFCDYRDLLKEIQNSYNPQVQTTELEVLQPIFEAEVLVLDELGAIRPSEWVWDTVSHIINYRYNEQKTTIITTNFPDGPSKREEDRLAKENQLEKRRRVIHRSKEDTEAAENATRGDTLGDRITDSMRSRLHEMCHVITIEGIDFRMRIKNLQR
jgi:DNA replication protein DnaC